MATPKTSAAKAKQHAAGLTSSGTHSSKKKRIRKIFGDIHEVVQMPNLIEVQRESYEQFIRSDKSTGYVSGQPEPGYTPAVRLLTRQGAGAPGGDGPAAPSEPARSMP